MVLFIRQEANTAGPRLLETPVLGDNTAAMKTTIDPLSYTETEIRSYLPSGWSLAGGPGGPEGAWDPRKQAWQVSVLDNVDFDWPVTVKAGDAGSHGRLEALRRAIDVVYRERLG